MNKATAYDHVEKVDATDDVVKQVNDTMRWEPEPAFEDASRLPPGVIFVERLVADLASRPDLTIVFGNLMVYDPNRGAMKASFMFQPNENIIERAVMGEPMSIQGMSVDVLRDVAILLSKHGLAAGVGRRK